MRIVVDYESCESHAACMACAPEIFEVRDDGALYVLDETPGEAFREAVEEAVRQCPTQSISLED